jgi:hypothetical protein
MADITKVSGVLFESISKVGPTLKSSISKISGKTTPPAITCVEYTFIYADDVKEKFVLKKKLLHIFMMKQMEPYTLRVVVVQKQRLATIVMMMGIVNTLEVVYQVY